MLICGIGFGMDRSLAAVKDVVPRLTVVTDQVTPRVQKYADRIIPVNPSHLPDITAAISNIQGITGVLSLGYDNPPAVSRLARFLHCPGVPVEAADICTFKDRRIQALRAAGLLVPRFTVADSLPEALDGMATIGLPAVVKPRDLSGSIGVAKLDNPENAASLIDAALRISPSHRVVIEEHLVGSEHTVAGFMIDDKLMVSGFADRDYRRKEEFAPYFFEGGDTLPTSLTPAQAAEVVDVVSRGAMALGLESTVINTDILRTADGRVYLLEITCRLTGARIATEIMPLSSGVNPLPNVIRLALGHPLAVDELVPTRKTGVVQRYRPAVGGTVDWIGDLGTLAGQPGVYDVFWGRELRPGDVLPRYQSSDDIVAGVIATGESASDADQVAERVLTALPLRLAGG